MQNRYMNRMFDIISIELLELLFLILLSLIIV